MARDGLQGRDVDELEQVLLYGRILCWCVALFLQSTHDSPLVANISLPGSSKVYGLWPAMWALGNLGRAGYGASLDGTWPYSYVSPKFKFEFESDWNSGLVRCRHSPEPNAPRRHTHQRYHQRRQVQRRRAFLSRRTAIERVHMRRWVSNIMCVLA